MVGSCISILQSICLVCFSAINGMEGRENGVPRGPSLLGRVIGILGLKMEPLLQFWGSPFRNFTGITLLLLLIISAARGHFSRRPLDRYANLAYR